MAKPYGLGSIKVSVNEVKVRNLSMLFYLEYSLNKYSISKESVEENLEKSFIDKFKEINVAMKMYDNISYPKAVKEKDGKTTKQPIFSWFVGNSKERRKFANKLISLKDVETEEDLMLKEYCEEK